MYTSPTLQLILSQISPQIFTSISSSLPPSSTPPSTPPTRRLKPCNIPPSKIPFISHFIHNTNFEKMKEVDVSLEDSPKKEATVGDGKAKVDEEIKEKVVLGSDGNNIKYKKVVTWNPDLVSESPIPRDSPDYEEHIRSSSYMGSPSASSPPINFTAMEFKNKVETVKGALGRWRKRVGEATKKAEDLAGNTWQHLKTSPSFTDAALGRIVHSTKVLAEGGYEKVFLQTFDTVPDETLQNSFACYLSTSVGPVMGVLYVSTEKLAYCSDNPVSYKDEDTTKWSYYKVTIPLHQLKSINPSTSSFNPSEKYIQVISVDNHEFWFMGFLNYTVAVTLLKEILEVGSKKSE